MCNIGTVHLFYNYYIIIIRQHLKVRLFILGNVQLLIVSSHKQMLT